MTSVDPTVTRGVDLTDREAPVDVRTYTERDTLVIGFLAPGVRLTLESAKGFRSAIDVHIKRLEIYRGNRRHPQHDPTEG